MPTTCARNPLHEPGAGFGDERSDASDRGAQVELLLDPAIDRADRSVARKQALELAALDLLLDRAERRDGLHHQAVADQRQWDDDDHADGQDERSGGKPRPTGQRLQAGLHRCGEHGDRCRPDQGGEERSAKRMQSPMPATVTASNASARTGMARCSSRPAALPVLAETPGWTRTFPFRP